MARLKITGLEDIEKRLQKREAAAAAAVPAVLKAGADVLIKYEKAEMERLKLVDTGDMVNSVKSTKVRKTDSGGFVEVYPQGKDRKGVSNATKAFVAQYGKSNLPARPWLTGAKAKGKKEINLAMNQAWKDQQK